MDLEKLYAEHKKRLQDNFIGIGNPELSGTNIPANVKHLWGETSNILSWGDSTIMMGYYIGMLATEYYLTIDAVKTFDKNKHKKALEDLKNALKTLDRLDSGAENSFDPKLPKDKLNGFFIRDDVHSHFLEKFPHLKNGGVTKVASDFTPIDFGNGNDSSKNKEMSQDQFWHLILGLSLVIKLVDDITCVKIAQDFVDRVMTYIKDNDWFIINPVTKQKVARGADVRVFSYAFCKACNYISPNVNKKNYKRYNVFNEAFFLTTRSTQRLLEKMGGTDKNYPYLALSTVGDINIDDDMSYITYHMENFGYYEHFPLIYNILHDKGNVTQYKKYYEDLLGKAPAVHYNYWKTTGKYSGEEWSADSRLINPENLGTKSPHFNGEYNGIDFMFLYNLYKIVYK